MNEIVSKEEIHRSITSINDKAILNLLDNMLLEEMSIEEAVKATMKREGPDPYNNSILLYYPLERSVLKVSDIFMNQKVVFDIQNQASYSK